MGGKSDKSVWAGLWEIEPHRKPVLGGVVQTKGST